jgi:bifunctional non-homologous end joining protein LigD
MSGPISPMLATKGVPPTEPGWAFEFKWDGIRGIASTEYDQLRLSTREGHNVTDNYPELAELRELLDGRSVVLDGEIIALAGGTDGRPRYPSLQALQGRLGRTRQLAMWMRDVPVYYHVFDVLRIDGVPVMNQPYIQRRQLLDELGLPTADARVLVPPNMTEPGDWPAGLSFPAALLNVADAHRLEGIIAKKMTSIYQPGRRSRKWIKTRLAEWRS